MRARSSTIAVREPRIRLKSVLLPTFGRPTMATMGIPPRALATGQAAPDAGTWSATLGGVGSEVVRPAGSGGAVEGGAGQLGGPGGRLGRAGHHVGCAR